MHSLSNRPERILASWRRVTLCQVRIAQCRRLWSCLGTYLKLVKQRGQAETDQELNNQQPDDQPPTNP